ALCYHSTSLSIRRSAQGSPPRRALLSFPTRRSSDLTPEVVLEADVPCHIERPCVVEGRPLPAPQIAPAQTRRPGVVDRSLPQLLAVGPAQYQASTARNHRRPAPVHVPARPTQRPAHRQRPAAAQIAATQGAPGARRVPVEVRRPAEIGRASCRERASIPVRGSATETKGPSRCERGITVPRHRSA